MRMTLLKWPPRVNAPKGSLTVPAGMHIEIRRLRIVLLTSAIGGAALLVGLAVFHWRAIHFLIEYERSVDSFATRRGAMIVDEVCDAAQACHGQAESRVVEWRCVVGLRRYGESGSVPEGWAAYAVLLQRDHLRLETWNEIESLVRSPSLDPDARDFMLGVMNALRKKAIPITPSPPSTMP